MRYTFDEVEINVERREIFLAGELRPVEPKVFDVLAYLAQNYDRVVGRDELLEACWPGIFVSDGTLSRCLSRVRASIGQGRSDNEPVRTLYKQGYRLVADVQSTSADGTAADSNAEQGSDTNAAVPPERRFVVIAAGQFRPASTGVQDAELLSAAIKSLMTDLAPVLERLGGGASRVTMDGVAIQFGYPIATERAAESALEAAQEITRRAKEVGLGARFGVAAGWTVVDADDASAARILHAEPKQAGALLDLSEFGQCTVDGRTLRLVQNAYFAKPVEDSLDAFAISKRAERLEQETDAPFMHRDPELFQMDQHLRRAKSGRGQLVSVTGEAGVGKTGFVEEFLRRGEIPADRLLRGNCTWRTRQTPFAPMLDVVRQIAGIGEGDPPIRQFALLENVLAKARRNSDDHLPLFTALLSAERAQESNEAAQRQLTLDVLAAVILENLQPNSIIWIDDVHWLDPSSLELLKQLQGTISSKPVMIVVTSRTGTVEQLDPNGTIELKPFDRRQVSLFLERCVDAGLLRQSQVEPLAERSDGVPLFLTEFIRNAELGDRNAIPETLRELLQARLDDAGPFKPTLQWASVLGRHFDADLLHAVDPASTQPEAMGALLDSGLVGKRSGSDELRFSHALVREAAYESIPQTNRRAFHKRTAEVMISDFPGIVERKPEIVAQHLEDAGQSGDAARYWQMAGRAAAAISGTEEARAQLSNALRSAQKSDTVASGDELVEQIQKVLNALN